MHKKTNLVRPYSQDAHMMLIMMHNEGDSLEQIANITDRDISCVRTRLYKLFKSGKAREIHYKLIGAGGLYALRMDGKKFPKFRFEVDT